MISYRPINFVVLRSAGIPVEDFSIFNLDEKLMEDIEKEKDTNTRIEKEINDYLENTKKALKQRMDDDKLRDMIRVSTPHFSTLIKEVKKSNSILSQYHRKILMYMQRGTFKCCTAGSYGPVTIGEFEHAAPNLKLFDENEERFIMIEDWALSLLLKKFNLVIGEEEYHDLMENYISLKKFGINKLDKLVDLIEKYKNNYSFEKRDECFVKIKSFFKEITGIEEKDFGEQKRKKDYESRSIFYELGKRKFSFQIGCELKGDLDKINKIFGIYLLLLTKSVLNKIKEDKKIKTEEQIKKFVFDNFYQLSEEIIEKIIKENIDDYEDIEYPFDVMPPIFSPDITVSAKDLNLLNQGDYKLIIGEIHVSATVISNPMYEFKRKKLIDEFVSGLKRITNEKIGFIGYNIEKDKDFTHHLPISVQTEIIKEFNKTSEGKTKIYAYRSNKYLVNREKLFGLLFFPLAIGRRLIFNYHKDENWGIWARDYFPAVIKRIGSKLFPELDNKIVIREEKRIKSPKIHLSNTLKFSSVFNFMHEISKWKRENHLGENIFVRYDPQRKPIYINLKNPYLVYNLIRFCESFENIWISNLIPNNEELWLKDELGSYYTEFRYMVFPQMNIQEIASEKKEIVILYLPGYKSRLDEFHLLKRNLSSLKESVEVESLNLDYDQSFDAVLARAKDHIKKLNAKTVHLVGLSIGGVLAIKLKESLKENIGKVFVVNAFDDRSKLFKERGYSGDFENITVPGFIAKEREVFVICSSEDKNINPEHSKRIHDKIKNSILLKIKGSDHTLTKEISQKELFEIIKSQLKPSF